MQWPAFMACTFVDGLILDALPPLSTRTLNLVDGVLIATFGNLFLLGAVAPFLTKRLLRRSALAVPAAAAPAPPEADREVLQDRVATLAMAAGVAACLVSGLANRPLIVSETRATEEVGRELQTYVNRSGSAELRRNLETANTLRLGEGYFRTCVARDDRRRYMCLFVDTNKDPVQVRRDPSNESNARLAGPNARDSSR
ncbi:MAG: hypothetical protein ACR2J6_06765 [Thermoleophilaceae bacterium]